MHLNVFALDLLQTLTLTLPVLVKLWESVPNVIHEQLRQLLVVFDHVAEEFAKVVIHNASEFLFEGERLQVFPLHAASLECIHTILELIYLLGLFGNKLVLFSLHSTHNYYVIGIEAEGEHIRDFGRHFHFKYCPNVKLEVEALHCVQEGCLV